MSDFNPTEVMMAKVREEWERPLRERAESAEAERDRLRDALETAAIRAHGMRMWAERLTVVDEPPSVHEIIRLALLIRDPARAALAATSPSDDDTQAWMERPSAGPRGTR